MKIVLLEPLGVPKEKIESLAAPFVEAGHDLYPIIRLLPMNRSSLRE